MESLAISLLAALAAAPLAFRAWRAGARATPLVGLVLWTVAVALAALAYQPDPIVSETEVVSRPVAVPSAGYVTSETCQACHPGQYASWRESYHRTMTQLATPESVLGHWAGRLQYGYSYDLERRGDEFWVRSNDPAFAGEVPSAEEGSRQVVLTTGSHHEQMYWYEMGLERGLAIFPMVYRISDRRWFPFDGVVLKPSEGVPHGAVRWNVNCVRCHTTDPRPGVVIEGDVVVQVDTQVSEFGIACEACHGSAERHVARQRDPIERYGAHLDEEEDGSIVNPSRLDSRRAADICGSCHSIHTSHTPEEVSRFLDEGYRFRPGERLQDTRYISRGHLREDPVAQGLLASNPHAYEDRFWPDGKPSAGGREFNGLIESPCYERGTLHCGSCHVMHQTADDPRPPEVWADDQLGVGMRGNEACLQCHSGFRNDLVAHTNHAEDSPGSLCYNCHMPNTTYGLLKQTRSHEVDSPSVQSTLETRRENACNLCHFDRSLAWTAEAMERWYDIPQPGLTSEQQSTAEGVLQALRGDAGQRAMLAWHMGWQPARAASQGDWMVPVLAQLLEDPYAAVRYVAGSALASFPDFADFDYDPMWSPERRREGHRAALGRWQQVRSESSRTPREAVLIGDDGELDQLRFDHLLSARDDRRVLRNE